MAARFDLQAESYLGIVGELLRLRMAGCTTISIGGSGSRFKTDVKKEDTIDRKGARALTAKWSIDEVRKIATPSLTALIKSGSRLYAGSQGKLLAVSAPLISKAQGKPAWEVEIEGTPTSLVAADGKLFAVTLEGRLYCFGASADAPAQPPMYDRPAARPLASDDAARARPSILAARACRLLPGLWRCVGRSGERTRPPKRAANHCDRTGCQGGQQIAGGPKGGRHWD
jgi:hypothetical protein